MGDVMSDTFVASNGIEVVPDEQDLYIGDPALSPLTPAGVAALREFFQHERDEELGRWRWPENPEYVVYKARAGERVPDARHVTVSNESNGDAAWLFEVESGGVSGGGSWARDAARAYFAAHPESKPWHDARHLSLWVLTLDGCASPEVYIRRGEVFRPVNNESRVSIDGRDALITGARRIWPEVSDAE